VIIVTDDVDEAVFISDRVIMMTNGPEASIGEILEVNLSHTHGIDVNYSVTLNIHAAENEYFVFFMQSNSRNLT